VDYISGRRKNVDADLRDAGFTRIGEAMYQKRERRIRYVSTTEQIMGIEGGGRVFVVRPYSPSDIAAFAASRGFAVQSTIET
jgi:hypothetical protein